MQVYSMVFSPMLDICPLYTNASLECTHEYIATISSYITSYRCSKKKMNNDMGMNGKHSMLILDITVLWVFVGMCLSLHSRDIRNIYFFAHCYMKVCRKGCWIRIRLISCIDGVPKMNQNIADLGYPH